MLLIEFADDTRLKIVGFGEAEGFGRQPDGLEVTDPCGLDATIALAELGLQSTDSPFH